MVVGFRTKPARGKFEMGVSPNDMASVSPLLPLFDGLVTFQCTIGWSLSIGSSTQSVSRVG